MATVQQSRLVLCFHLPSLTSRDHLQKRVGTLCAQSKDSVIFPVLLTLQVQSHSKPLSEYPRCLFSHTVIVP